MGSFAVYIVTNEKDGVLYIGMTNNLKRRVYEHKNHLTSGFTSKYRLTKLVYFEIHETAMSAIQREKAIKKWNRQWKIDLIITTNPNWNDLYESI